MLWELCPYARAYAPYTHALTGDPIALAVRTNDRIIEILRDTDVKRRVYETLQREQNGGLELAWSRVSL